MGKQIKWTLEYSPAHLKEIPITPSYDHYLLSTCQVQGTVLVSGMSHAFGKTPRLLKEVATKTWGQAAASTWFCLNFIQILY